MQASRQAAYIEFRPRISPYLLFTYFGAHFYRAGGLFRPRDAPKGRGRRLAGGLGVVLGGYRIKVLFQGGAVNCGSSR